MLNVVFLLQFLPLVYHVQHQQQNFHIQQQLVTHHQIVLVLVHQAHVLIVIRGHVHHWIKLTAQAFVDLLTLKKHQDVPSQSCAFVFILYL
jgi:hypothetical protein